MNNINDINIYEAFKNMDLFESDIKKDIQNLNNTIDCLESCISEYKKRQAYFPIPLGYSPKSWKYFELKTSNFFYNFHRKKTDESLVHRMNCDQLFLNILNSKSIF